MLRFKIKYLVDVFFVNKRKNDDTDKLTRNQKIPINTDDPRKKKKLENWAIFTGGGLIHTQRLPYMHVITFVQKPGNMNKKFSGGGGECIFVSQALSILDKICLSLSSSSCLL